MRDPWFLIAVILAFLITVWLGIFGPMPSGFVAWLQGWQTLMAAIVASIAALVAFTNTTRSLKHAQQLESNRRSRKHAAVRAVLPLALAQTTAYAEQSARDLNKLVGACDKNEALPLRTVPNDLVKPVPSETLKIFGEFIEYSDALDVGIVQKTVAWIQIHDSRMRALVHDNHDPLENHIIVRHELEGRILDAASIYAAAAAMFEYARGLDVQLPTTISWEEVRGALRNMRFWDGEHSRLYNIIGGREGKTYGPFDRLNSK